MRYWPNRVVVLDPDGRRVGTKEQGRALARLKAEFWRRASLGSPEDYEWKKFEVTDLGFALALYVEVGRVGDERTLASVFCRARFHVFVGPNGGLKALPEKGKGWLRGPKAWRAMRY